MAFFDRAKSDAEIRAIRQNVNPYYDKERRLLIKGIAAAATSGVLASTAHGVASAESDEYGSPNTLPITSRLRGVDTAATYGGFFDFSGVDSPRLPENFTRDVSAKVEALGLRKVISRICVLPLTDSKFNLSLEDTYNFDKRYEDESINPITFYGDNSQAKTVTMLVANYEGQHVQGFMHEVAHILDWWLMTPKGPVEAVQAFNALSKVKDQLYAYQIRDLNTVPVDGSKLWTQYEKDIWQCHCMYLAEKSSQVQRNQQDIFSHGFKEWRKGIGPSSFSDNQLFAQYLSIKAFDQDKNVRSFLRGIIGDTRKKKTLLEVTEDMRKGLLSEGFAELFANFHTLAPSMNGVPQKFKDNLHKIILK